MSEADRVTVHVKYGEVEQTFSGSVDDVWVSVNRFFGELIPTFAIASKMTLTVDLAALIEDFKGAVAIAPEGPEVLIPKERLTDSETLMFTLLAVYVGNRLGKSSSDAMTKEDLQRKLGKTMKITTTRLGELVKQGIVVKTDDGNYRISTVGIRKAQEEVKAIKMEIW